MMLDMENTVGLLKRTASSYNAPHRAASRCNDFPVKRARTRSEFFQAEAKMLVTENRTAAYVEIREERKRKQPAFAALHGKFMNGFLIVG